MSESGDDEWADHSGEDVPLSQEASSAVGSPSRKKKKVKKKSLKPKAKSKAKAKKEQPRCFAAQCPNQKAGKSRFCFYHRPMYQSIEYQAVKARTLPQVQRVFLDAEQAAEAFTDGWERDVIIR